MDLMKTRQQIDDVDKQLFLLLQKRMELVNTVAQYKEANKSSIRDVHREKQILDRIEDYVSPEYAPWVKDMYKNMMCVSRNYQKSKIHLF